MAIRRTLSQRSELIHDWNAFGVNPDSREIFLACPDDMAEEEINWKCAARFIKNITILNSFNHFPILIRQCTVGGSWNYGMAIYDAIVSSPSPTVVLAYAAARSMSSIIPQAAKRRVIMPEAEFMIHFGTACFDGDSRSFVAEGRREDILDEHMLDLYVKRCNRGPFWRRNKYSRARVRAELQSWMNVRREVYMSAAEAVDYGFMDGVFGTGCFRTISDIMKF